ncbi:putative ubiquitin carboxyl-terminal hydrolase 6 [Iris pallida]|uniref:Ubiquitin carboxyl-terminal hydrolase 6 n=1 Tax=Iris pallida TaxID=29817 RepID=A0AAX6EV08_IRIPA|nr:putative ubiquitin carboxyl-terminal hydrolase 6 [Iris pallida]
MYSTRLILLETLDYHSLMQQVLPIAIRSVLPKHVRYAVTRFCLFFNNLCGKSLAASKLDEIQNDIVKTLCLFEKYLSVFL